MTAFFAKWPSGRWVKFRSLTWAEYREYEPYLQSGPQAGVYYDIYKRVFLSGSEKPEYASAGVVHFVGESLTANNPFNGRFDDVDRARNLKKYQFQSDYLQAARAVIASIFHYTFEDIDKWDPETFFERLAAAEYVSGRELAPKDPLAKQKMLEARKQRMTAAQRAAGARPAPRDSRMPLADEEMSFDPDVNDIPERPPVQKRPLTTAQQMVINRKFNRS